MSDFTHAKQFKREIFSIVDRLKEMQVDLRSLNVIDQCFSSFEKEEIINQLRRLSTALDPFPILELERTKVIICRGESAEMPDRSFDYFITSAVL